MKKTTAKTTTKSTAKTTTAAKPAAAKTTPRKPLAEHLPFVTDDSAEAYEHFGEEARAAASSPDAENYNADLNVVPNNVEAALEAIDPHLSRDDVTPATRARIRELPTLVIALIHADSRVTQEHSTGAVAEAQAVQRPLRQLTLSYLEIASSPLIGLVPADRVQKIRENRGPDDEARDGIGIAGVFKEFASVLANNHPFKPAHLATLEAKSVFLTRTLKPGNAPPDLTPQERDESTLTRDGLWTLIVRAYDELLLVAAKVWGVRRVGDNVPALLGRTAESTKKAEGEGAKKPNGDVKPQPTEPTK